MNSITAPSASINHSNGRLKRTLAKGLEFINWKEYIKRDSVVLVKPNFTFPSHREGVTTSPRLLRRLLEILKNRSRVVIIGESDGGNNSFSAENSFKGHHMYSICKDIGADLVNFSKIESEVVESNIQGKSVKVRLPVLLLKGVDCFISVPVMKVHAITGVSLGLKNLWGCYPDTMRCLHHQNLDRKLALIAKHVNPKITIIDGLYALNNHGPMFGDTLKMGLILTSNDIVLADTLGTAIMGVPLRKVAHIMIAEKEGMGTTDLRNAKINDDWKQYKKDFQIRKTPIDRLASLLFHSDLAARLVIASPFTPLIYSVGNKLRSADEKRLSSQLSNQAYGI